MKNRIIFFMAFIFSLYASFQPILAWYSGYSNWNYRMEINITDRSGNNLDNYQVWMNISYSPAMQSNFGDLRFTYYNPSNGQETEIPYWIENSINDEFAETWVNVTYIPANDNTTIYMYYGNHTASDESNANNVFYFFEDFETWSGWIDWQSGGVSQVDGGAPVYQGTYSLQKHTNCHPDGGYKDMGITLDRSGWAIEFHRYRISGDGSDCYADRTGVGASNGDGYNVGFTHAASPICYVDRMTGTTTTNVGQSSSSADILDEWHVARLIINSSHTQSKIYKLDMNVLCLASSTDTTYSSFTHVFIEGGRPFYVDNIKVRKYTSPEPFVSMGSVEAPSIVFCCRDAITGSDKCWSSGFCCLQGEANEYWSDTGCYGFRAWLQPKTAAFVVGQKTPINLYIENIGAYTDSYEITYSTLFPDLVLVDISYISPVKNVGPGEVRLVNPQITVISAILTGTVDFTITSENPILSPQIVTLMILESELPLSLPEFGFFSMILLIIFSGIIYFVLKRKH